MTSTLAAANDPPMPSVKSLVLNPSNPERALPLLETRAHRREVSAFLRAHPIPTAARALRQALEEFDTNAEFRHRAAPQLRHWLGS